MNIFRVRQYGSGSWTLVSVNTPGDEEDDSGMVATLSSIIGSALDTSSELHVQRMNDDGEWEDLE